MKAVIFYCSWILCVSRVFSVTISSPAMQRKIAGESATFRWSVTGNFTSYTIKLLSTGGSPTTLGSNVNHTYDNSKSVIKLFIWNIQTSNAGYYSLSINTGPSPEMNSVAVLFLYATPYAYTVLAVGRNPSFEGDTIELNCSVTSNSLPVEFRTKTYLFWYNSYYGGLFRNTSSGPAVLQNGDVLSAYNLKNDGKTLVIASAQSADSGFYCSVKEEGSPYNSASFGLYSLAIYSKPYAYSFTPASRKFNAALYSNVNLYFYCQTNPPLLSYTNWSFVNASGSTTEYTVGSNPLTSMYVPLSFYLFSANSYGNYSITLTNSNGSRTATFQVLPSGPPETPSNFSVQYVTHSFVSLQWRCRWFNGVQQTVFVRLMDATNDLEVETQTVSLATNCYNSAYSTLFQNNIQPERDYKGSIWSISTLGSSSVVNLTVSTSKRLVFDTSSANISITGTQAVINFRIADSSKAILWLNITCCVESTTQCSNQSYSIANTDNQIAYDALPTGTQYVFDFIVYDTDGYTYVSTLAIVKGVRVSKAGYIDPTQCLPPNSNQLQCAGKENLLIAVIVLAVLLGVALLMLLGCCITFLVCRCRQNNSHQQSTTVPISAPARPPAKTREPSAISNGEDFYEPVVDLAPSKENAYYKSLESAADKDKQSSEASRKEMSYDQEDNYEELRDDIFHMKSVGTLDRPKRNRYQ